jgi:transglutaminase-like putative cysteine protease
MGSISGADVVSSARIAFKALMGLCLALLVLGTGESRAAQATPAKGAVPSWVKPVALQEDAPVPVEQIRNGIYYLLADRQIRVDGKDWQRFQHYAVKVVNEQGLEDAANLDISFNPSYQKLELHTLALHRKGDVISQLSSAQIRVLQREKDLEALVFDGRLTASILFRDVRVGDVVEYAYTVRGENPVFQGRHFGALDMQWRDPVHHVYTRLMWPSLVPIQFKNPNMTEAATESQQGKLREFEWSSERVPGLRVSKGAPVWFDPYPYVQWSAFADWGDVSRWALPLYKVPALPQGELAGEVRRISQDFATPRERAAAALQYVQKNIRYLSVDVGVGSYQPSPPTTVMERRFGDCKDKTLLLLTMLKALGLDARAALVNTRIREGLQQRIPSPGAFDHVLVQLRVDGQTYWLDPTRSPQPGRLDTISQPYFGHALVVDPQTRELEPMHQGEAMQYTRNIRTLFDATEGVGKPAHLTVISVLKGLSAERMRNDMARSNLDELQRQYVNFYASYYPGIVAEGPMAVEDDEQSNQITTTERYRIVDFWTKEGEEGQLAARIKSPDLLSYLQDPEEVVRDAPLAISHATVIEDTTEVRLPEDWDVKPRAKVIQHSAFMFAHKLVTSPTILTHSSRYISLEDHVPVKDMADYVQKLKDARSAMWLELTYTPEAAATASDENAYTGRLTSIGWPVAIYFLAVGFVCFWFGRWVYRYNPGAGSDTVDAPAKPLGGWLILMGIALVVDVLRIAPAIWPNASNLVSDVWSGLHPGTGLSPVVRTTYEDLFVLGLLALFSTPIFVRAILFFQRRNSFPRVSYWLVGLVTAIVLLQYVWGEPRTDKMVQWKELVEVAIGLAWCVYLYRSERVKATFVRRYQAVDLPISGGTLKEHPSPAP